MSVGGGERSEGACGSRWTSAGRIPTRRCSTPPGVTRDSALTTARAEAVARAAEAGADPASIEIVDIDEIPLAYLPSNALRVRVKAGGDLANAEWGVRNAELGSGAGDERD